MRTRVFISFTTSMGPEGLEGIRSAVDKRWVPDAADVRVRYEPEARNASAFVHQLSRWWSSVDLPKGDRQPGVAIAMYGLGGSGKGIAYSEYMCNVACRLSTGSLGIGGKAAPTADGSRDRLLELFLRLDDVVDSNVHLGAVTCTSLYSSPGMHLSTSVQGLPRVSTLSGPLVLTGEQHRSKSSPLNIVAVKSGWSESERSDDAMLEQAMKELDAELGACVEVMRQVSREIVATAVAADRLRAGLAKEGDAAC